MNGRRTSIYIPDDEISFTFARAGGPGGQNVNKVETKAVLRFHVRGSRALTEAQKERILASREVLAASDGETITITAQRFRSQGRNRDDAVSKLAALLERALRVLPKRVRTKPTRASIEKRLGSKRLRGERKGERGRRGWE